MSSKRSSSKGPRPYAEGTSVSVSQSKHEIEVLLMRNGGDQVLTGSNRADGLSFIGFTMQGRQFRIHMKRREGRGSPDQREREQWRALLLVLKGKLEIIARGDTTPEREFLADLVLPDGSTLGEALAPQIADTYANGAMPKLLGMGPSSSR